MKNKNEAVAKKMRLLITKFALKLPSRIQGIEKKLNILVHHSWDKEAARQLYFDLHKLSGTGTSFGFKKLSHASRKMEMYLARLLGKEKELDKHEVKRLRSLFTELQKSVEHFKVSLNTTMNKPE
jgi:chemotaxis protein histidine kinase CheA